METEKVCINLAAAELGKIDVLVAQGLFASRTDLIREGIRALLRENEDAVRDVEGTFPRIGYQLVTRGELEGAKAANRRLQITAVGVLRFAPGITPDLADETIEQVRVFGSIRGPKAVLERLASRTTKGFG
jgi:Arc/MetJ-type ribon-helix-helix transcriptional regulator